MVKIKVWIISAIVVVFVCCAAGFVAANGMFSGRRPSEYKIGITYDEVQESDKPAIVLFYADWCTYCLKFMPKFKTIYSLYKDKFNFTMVDIEEAGNEKMIEDYGIAGFPMVYVIDPKYDNRVLLNNAIYMDLKKFRAELDRFLRIRKILDREE